MARPINRQARSVGNLGDILKHAALFEIASMLAATSETVAFVDTHTFLLHAPLADAERWDREVGGLLASHAAYAGYAALERDARARTGAYRCSSGVVIDVLGARRSSATLGELNGVTRAALRDQIAGARLTGILVADDAVAALRDAPVEGAGAVLLHVDPFSLSATSWAEIAPGLDALCARAARVGLVVYRYTRSAPSPWPAAPRGLAGPVAQIRGGPHEIAAYASRDVAGAVREVCAALGWRGAPGGSAEPRAPTAHEHAALDRG